ncbi:MAG: thymidine phosphorylase [Patescibacteria group bacterium]|nr:thymidine phosphorylase [Patescibacteria group bacterium]MDD5121537.1 thymidine phosphorylase [Patescibacteria group bacterium]MDD5222101.1 thymidine phosphorylase [Patescibacteria group bacterium]MDD5396299.1 thymidine phosphorylase [Patescibacteria group bacterium]
MKNFFFLRVKKLDIETGSPWVVIINNADAQRNGLRAGDQLLLRWGKHTREVIVDITDSMVKPGQIGLFEDIINKCRFENNKLIQLTLSTHSESIKAIQKKILGKKLSYKEIYSIINDVVEYKLDDAEMAFFVAGAFSKSTCLSRRELFYLAKAIAYTGKIFRFGNIVVDKHSIGGIPGNRVTPIIVAIIASYGIIIPKTSTRAVTSAAGTADTFEVLAPVTFGAKDLQKFIKKANAFLVWGAEDIAPADDRILSIVYKLGIELYNKMIVSIIAKKVGEGVTHLILDIPVGPTAKVTNMKDARKIANLFLFLAKKFNIKIKIIISKSVKGPIGKGIGPTLEARDVLRVLQQKENRPIDLEEKSILLAGKLLELTGKVKKGLGSYFSRKALINGNAWKKMKQIITIQGGKPLDSEQIKQGKIKLDIIAHKTGRITEVHNKNLVEICRLLGAPGTKTAGIYFHKMIKEPVKTGDVLFTLYTSSILHLSAAKEALKKIWIYKIK